MSNYLKNVLAGFVKTSVSNSQLLQPGVNPQSTNAGQRLMQRMQQQRQQSQDRRSISPVAVRQAQSSVKSHDKESLASEIVPSHSRAQGFNLNITPFSTANGAGQSSVVSSAYFNQTQDTQQPHFLLQSITGSFWSTNAQPDKSGLFANDEFANIPTAQHLISSEDNNSAVNFNDFSSSCFVQPSIAEKGASAASSPWDTEAFQADAAYWDRVVEQSEDVIMDPMPGAFLQQNKPEEDAAEPVINNDFRVKYKTEMCKNFVAYNNCDFGDKCSFAHGIDELQSKKNTHKNYKTKACKRFQKEKYCPYGDRCQFIHEMHVAEQPSFNKTIPIQKQQMRKKPIIYQSSRNQPTVKLNEIEKQPNNEAFKVKMRVDNNDTIQSIQGRRLAVFQNITQ